MLAFEKQERYKQTYYYDFSTDRGSAFTFTPLSLSLSLSLLPYMIVIV